MNKLLAQLYKFIMKHIHAVFPHKETDINAFIHWKVLMTSATPVVLWTGHIPCKDLFPCCWKNARFDELNMKNALGIYNEAYD